MKFYVAARFSEKEKVLRIYKLLGKNGHTITADWTVHKNIKPYNKNPKIARDYALEDMNGVIDCDVFILLTSDSPGSGSSGELGAAIYSFVKFNKPKIYIVGQHMGNNFFYFYPEVNRRQTIEEVLNELQ